MKLDKLLKLLCYFWIGLLVFFCDSVLANNGGDLGWIFLWDMDEDFAFAVQNLNKLQISEPMKTKWGYNIIQLLNREDDVFVLEDDYLRKKSL